MLAKELVGFKVLFFIRSALAATKIAEGCLGHKGHRRKRKPDVHQRLACNELQPGRTRNLNKENDAIVQFIPNRSEQTGGIEDIHCLYDSLRFPVLL